MTKKDKKAELVAKYPYIVAWGQKLGSYGYYMEDQVALAEKDNAPKDAIFRQSDGTWATASELSDEGRAELDDYLNGTRGGVIIHWY